LRVYVIGRGYQATEIDPADAARRFMVWLAGAGNPVLEKIIQLWLSQPPDVGGLGALAESGVDIARLRAEVTANWEAEPRAPGMDGEVAP
jgi:hypothetical protein